MKQFLVEPLMVHAITRGGQIHDTPVLTRATLSKPNKGEYLARSIYEHKKLIKVYVISWVLKYFRPK